MLGLDLGLLDARLTPALSSDLTLAQMSVTQLSRRLSIFSMKLTSILPCTCCLAGADPDSEPIVGKGIKKTAEKQTWQISKGPTQFLQPKETSATFKTPGRTGYPLWSMPTTSRRTASERQGPVCAAAAALGQSAEGSSGAEPRCKATGHRAHGGLVGTGQRGSTRKQETRHRARAAR